MGRVLRASRPTRVPGGSGLARTFRLRCVGDQCGEDRLSAGESVADGAAGEQSDRVDGISLWTRVWKAVPGRTVSGRGRGRAVQADDPGLQLDPSEPQSHVDEHGGACGPVEWRGPD